MRLQKFTMIYNIKFKIFKMKFWKELLFQETKNFEDADLIDNYAKPVYNNMRSIMLIYPFLYKLTMLVYKN